MTGEAARGLGFASRVQRDLGTDVRRISLEPTAQSRRRSPEPKLVPPHGQSAHSATLLGERSRVTGFAFLSPRRSPCGFAAWHRFAETLAGAPAARRAPVRAAEQRE